MNLKAIDETLLYWLRIQPSEIDALDMETYYDWADFALRVWKAHDPKA